MRLIILFLSLFLGNFAFAQDYSVKRVSSDLSDATKIASDIWEAAPEVAVSLLPQMMVKPKPAKAETEIVKTQILHDGKFIAYRLRWVDKEKSEAGKLGEFSDAIALEFPVKDNENPPPIFMGFKDNPVHIFHWRAQYQYDEEQGKKGVKDIYPNMSSDMYPLEFSDNGSLKGITDEKRETFVAGKAAGNPQSSPKRSVDEVMAEGYGSSAVTEDHDSSAHGVWQKGTWTVVITRALKRPKGSVLEIGKTSAFGIAVWQGGKDEVGSRKSITMQWTPFKLEVK